MKTIYTETVRICEYKYHYNNKDYQSVIEAGFGAKFDAEEQIIKLDYCAYFNTLDLEVDLFEQESERTEVVYLYHVEELMNDFDAFKLERPYSLKKVCLVSEGRLWRWLVSKADAHYDQIMKVIKEWRDQHHVLEGDATGDRYLLWITTPKVLYFPASS